MQINKWSPITSSNQRQHFQIWGHELRWRNQNAKKSYIKGRLLDQAMILFNWVPFSKLELLFPLWAVPYSMENHFYHIKWPPLNVTIFITHVRNLRNGCYANVLSNEA